MKNTIIYLILICTMTFSSSFPENKNKTKTARQSATFIKDTNITANKPLITFVELGSVNCIPCKAMQKVMKAIEAKYGNQIIIVFYDVWTEKHAPYAQKYNIRLIPTQVFLDASGNELMRHEGFFPEKDIDAFLQGKGLKPKTADKG